jgi:RNA polymerase sigma-70 factor (ECF subfamily)
LFLSTFSSGFDDEDGAAVDPERFHAAGPLAGSRAFPPHPWDEATPEKVLSSKEDSQFLEQAIRVLPDTLREVLVLREMEGLECKEICAMLAITETNFSVRLHRGRERVRQAV